MGIIVNGAGWCLMETHAGKELPEVLRFNSATVHNYFSTHTKRIHAKNYTQFRRLV